MGTFLGYDDSNLKPAEIFEALPAGKYQAVLTDCTDVTPCKSGNGRFIKLTFEIISGEYKGRKIFQRYNIWHSNEQTQEIARRELKNLRIVAGVPNAQWIQEVLNLPVTIKLKLRPANGEYDASNEIAGFAVKETPSYALPAAGTVPSVPATPAAPPWDKK